MALNEAEQAELDRLITKKVAAEPRTEEGVVGVLHALIDTVSGAVAHRGAGEWSELHKQAEALAAPEPAPKTAAERAPEPMQKQPGPYSTEESGFAG